MKTNQERPDFLAHYGGDYVAVAVRNIEPGEARVGYLDDAPSKQIKVNATVPLGHKVALRDVKSGEEVIEYQLQTAIATQDIAEGDYVHVHNVRSARWQNSVA